MQKQEFEERIERTVTDEQYKVIEEVYMWHPSIRNTSGKDEVGCMGRHEEQGHHGRCDVQGCQL